MQKLIWLIGHEFSAMRLKGHKHWSILPNQDLPDQKSDLPDDRFHDREINVGVLLLLQHPELVDKDDPSVYFQNKLMSSKALSPSIVLYAGLLVSLSLILFWSYFLIEEVQSVDKAQFSFAPLIVFFLSFTWAYSFLSTVESSLILRKLKGTQRVLHWSVLGLQSNPIIWNLGRFHKQAMTLILIALTFGVGVWLITPAQIYLGTGLLLGTTFWFTLATLPLRAGPMDALMKYFLSIEESPYRLLKWSIEGKILPAGQKVTTSVSWSLTLLSFVLLGWVFGLLRFLTFIKEQFPTTYFANAIFLELFISVVGAGICLYFLASIFTFYKRALSMSKQGSIQEFDPSPEEVEQWHRQSALLYHIPILRDLNWKWMRVPEATWLIQSGEQSRGFYWIHQGEAKVFGTRDSGKDFSLKSTLHSGSGFGELALLDDTSRNSDVFINKDSLLVYLSAEEFEKASNAFYNEHFRKIVQATQMFEQMDMFRNIPSIHREEWLLRALILDFDAGETLIEQGTDDQWMGLILKGQVEVVRDGQRVACLESKSIIGEMSYISQQPRSASLVALEPVTILRWESGWWADQAEKLGLRPYFEELTRRRS